jgi:hypothetical protein
VSSAKILVAVGANGTVLLGRVAEDNKIAWDAPTRLGDQHIFAVAAMPETHLVAAVEAGGTVSLGTVTAHQIQWKAPTQQGLLDLYGVTEVPGKGWSRSGLAALYYTEM